MTDNSHNWAELMRFPNTAAVRQAYVDPFDSTLELRMHMDVRRNTILSKSIRNYEEFTSMLCELWRERHAVE